MINATVIGTEQVLVKLKGMYPAMMQEIIRTTDSIAIQLTAYVKAQKLSGSPLKNRTGNLRRSINYSTQAGDTSSTGIVGANNSAPYARIQEYGGQTKPHLIEARNAKSLAFMAGGRMVFAKSVQHPGSNIPERSFLRSALKDFEPRIHSQYEAAASRVLR